MSPPYHPSSNGMAENMWKVTLRSKMFRCSSCSKYPPNAFRFLVNLLQYATFHHQHSTSTPDVPITWLWPCQMFLVVWNNSCTPPQSRPITKCVNCLWRRSNGSILPTIHRSTRAHRKKPQRRNWLDLLYSSYSYVAYCDSVVDCNCVLTLDYFWCWCT